MRREKKTEDTPQTSYIIVDIWKPQHPNNRRRRRRLATELLRATRHSIIATPQTFSPTYHT